MNAGNSPVFCRVQAVFCRILMLMMLTLLVNLANADEFTASVDRTVIGQNESLTLTLKVSGAASATKPDTSDLARDFQIVSQRSNSSMSFVNGKRSASIEWVYTLMPRRSGMLVIPSFRSDQMLSDAIPIEVRASSGNIQQTGRALEINLELSHDEVYVQQQLRLTVRITSARAVEGARFQAPAIANADFLDLGEKQYEKVVDGQRFIVLERDYVLFPQASGELIIPPFEATIALLSTSQRGFFFGTPTDNYVLRTEPRKLTVLPQPDSVAGGDWLPAKNLTLSEEWPDQQGDIHVGDSLTRTLVLQAEGLHSAQLPELVMQEQAGIRVYAEMPNLSDSHNRENVLGKRVQSMALVMTEPGDIQLPDLRVRWWDTSNAVFRESVLPGRLLKVLPATSSAAASEGKPINPTVSGESVNVDNSRPDEDLPEPLLPEKTAASLWSHPLWALASGLLLLLWLLTLMLWYISRHNRPSAEVQVSASQSRKANANALLRDCIVACRKNRPGETRSLLRQWAKCYFGLDKDASIREIDVLMADETFSAELEKLERALFTPASAEDWDGSRLASILERLPTVSPRSGGSPDDSSVIPPLYPACHRK